MDDDEFLSVAFNSFKKVVNMLTFGFGFVFSSPDIVASAIHSTEKSQALW